MMLGIPHLSSAPSNDLMVGECFIFIIPHSSLLFSRIRIFLTSLKQPEYRLAAI